VHHGAAAFGRADAAARLGRRCRGASGRARGVATGIARRGASGGVGRVQALGSASGHEEAAGERRDREERGSRVGERRTVWVAAAAGEQGGRSAWRSQGRWALLG
jgi:hypothetical protein